METKVNLELVEKLQLDIRLAQMAKGVVPQGAPAASQPNLSAVALQLCGPGGK